MLWIEEREEKGRRKRSERVKKGVNNAEMKQLEGKTGEGAIR